MKHSAAFIAVRDAILGLDDPGRARLAAFFGAIAEPHRPLGELRAILRAAAALNDEDLERLARWFTAWVNRWGGMPRSTGMSIDPHARRDPPGENVVDESSSPGSVPCATL